ncbi:murein biosynthesis integral membrane protein MurJ [Streptomyces armeniacus]|uniref:Murein biosynthesis integral membrane protein MurJ n=1 Tax=Streptomyces armeniacus TaxID=83291 RepID=A0A345XUJ1_9ACTN|nr:murein biosynthesis integral membrane protein MurJ [Streptomyces armeniacus]AXK35307.1 murein biosynthesis integral membrane protein MurJ [Streptomyces armeniacus]
MNAPYDGDRGGGPQPPDDPYAQNPYGEDPYAQDPYQQDPYRQDDPRSGYAQDPYAQDPHGQQDPYGQYPQGRHPQGRPPYAQDPYAQQPPPPDAYGQDPYAQDPYAQDPYVQDAYAQDAYKRDPYLGGPSPHGPAHDGRYDGAAHPPPPAGPQDPRAQQYQPPPPGPYGPDPRHWAPAPAPQSEGFSQYMPYGDDPATVQFTGLDDLLTQAPRMPRRPREPRDPRTGHGQGYGAEGYGHGAGQAPPQAPGQGQGGAPYVGPAGVKPNPEDAFAHLFRDQYPARTQPHGADGGATGAPPAPGRPPGAGEGPAQAPQQTGGKAAGLLRSSAIMAAGTMVSRLTGFVRSALILVALGATTLGDTYQLAITLPTMIYILTVGGGLNSVFVPQLVRAMKEDEDGGEAYANRLLTLVAVILGLLAVAAVVAAPALVQLMSVKIANDRQANEIAVTFVRYCLPSIFFMGIHVVMGQILNARGRFGAMMWTPVLNNVVIIFTIALFLWVYGTASHSALDVETIPPEGVRLLGAGTLLGLVTQSLAMIPYLRAAGFRIRPRFDWRGHGLGKAAKLAKWTVLFVLANQAGVLVVTQLSTWAGAVASENGHPGTNYIAYSNAQLIWTMPHAIITVSVMAALLPRLSRAASDGDTGAVRDDISQGLRNSAVAIVPIAFGFIALGIPMCTFIFGSAGADGARSIGYMLMAFGLGLIPYSVQYIVLRAFYAYEDTRTPFYNTVIVAAVNAAASGLCFVLLPARWAVVGMAASYGLAYIIGVRIAWRRLSARLGGDLDGARIVRTFARLCGASIPAALASGGAAYAVTGALGSGFLGSVCSLLAGGLTLAVVFVLAGKRMRIEEMNAMVGMVRGRLGR